MTTDLAADIVNVRRTTDDEWNATWRTCSYATYFHSPEWSGIWRRYDPTKVTSVPRTITFSDGREVILPLSARHLRRGFPRTFLSSPAGTFGGWIGTQPLGAAHAECLLEYFRNELRSVNLRQNPFDPLAIAASGYNHWTFRDFTQVIDYGVGLKRIHEVLRKNQIVRKYRQAERAHLTLVKVAKPAEVHRYSEIYATCRVRWGNRTTTAYDPKLFHLFDLASPHIDFWAVEKDGGIIAAGPFFKSGKNHVVSWLTLADPDYLSLKPYEFLYCNLIDHYGQKGFRYFDFNPSGGNEGVVKFKASFGTKMLPAHVLCLTPLRHRMIQRMASSLAGATHPLRQDRARG